MERMTLEIRAYNQKGEQVHHDKVEGTATEVQEALVIAMGHGRIDVHCLD
jgi:hypothetical protein